MLLIQPLKTDYDVKISDIKKKHFTSCDYNQFTSNILNAKVKEKELIDKSDISNFVKSLDLNTKLATLAIKA